MPNTQKQNIKDRNPQTTAGKKEIRFKTSLLNISNENHKINKTSKKSKHFSKNTRIKSTKTLRKWVTQRS